MSFLILDATPNISKVLKRTSGVQYEAKAAAKPNGYVFKFSNRKVMKLFSSLLLAPVLSVTG